MSRVARLSIVVVVAVVVLEARSVPAQTPDTTRAIAFNFTATERAQIALWIESADGTFLTTVRLTQAVSVLGIGNRPGAAQMNSGYHWPYGRREGVLPIWAHRRAAAPGAVQFPRIIFQKRHEGYASQTCPDSTGDPYFCLGFDALSTLKDGLDAVSCASKTRLTSDKGRILTSADVAAGYAEPTASGRPPVWQPADRLLGITSLYPPRRDYVTCADAATVNPCMGGSSACMDHPDVAKYADAARAAMPDIDAVTMATPPADTEQMLMFSVPGSWPDGEYVAFMEINTEGDYDATFDADSHATPCSPYPTGCPEGDWDIWAVDYGYPYRGQPSVVFSVPFTLGAEARFSTLTPVGFGSVDGTEAAPGAMHAMDVSISDDPQGAPGSGADRLRMSSTQTYRLELEVRACSSHEPPAVPMQLTAEPVADVKHSHQWGHLHFVAPASDLPIAAYEVRTSTDRPIVEGDPESFIRGLPAQAASVKTEGLMVPVSSAPGTPVDVDFGGLNPQTHYWVAVRAVDSCNRAGPHAVVEVTTTRIAFTQLPPIDLAKGQCFVATAAWGSAMASQVQALRRARDRLRPGSAMAATAVDLYYRSGPAAAAVIGRSDTARAAVRRLLSPVATLAELVF